MTIDEVIKKLEWALQNNTIEDVESSFEYITAISMAIESLAALNKIRDEIANHCGLLKEDHCKYCSYCNSVMGVREILEIIDKYRVESEEKE